MLSLDTVNVRIRSASNGFDVGVLFPDESLVDSFALHGVKPIITEVHCKDAAEMSSCFVMGFSCHGSTTVKLSELEIISDAEYEMLERHR